METNNQNIKNNGLGRLIIKLKKEDSTYAKLCKAIQIIYWIFIPIFTLLTILQYIEINSIYKLYKGIFFVSSFLIFALFFKNYYKEYRYVDYSLPTIQMLKKAAWRYQPFQKRSIWILLALILMDVGLTFDWIEEGVTVMLIIQSIFWSIVIISVIIGLVIWYIKYKSIRDEALRLIKEIEGE